MSFLENLLYGIADDMKRPHEQFAPIIDKLTSNWFTDKEALLGITKEGWKDLNIPMAVILKIK